MGRGSYGNWKCPGYTPSFPQQAGATKQSLLSVFHWGNIQSGFHLLYPTTVARVLNDTKLQAIWN